MLLSKTHCLRRVQRLPISLDACWAFFSDPLNLPKIIPDWVAFTVDCSPARDTYAGQILQYTLRPILGIPVRWTTEITHCRPPHFFVDEQRLGPYRFWHHQHTFTPLSEIETEVEDLVHYALPLGPLGRFVEPWLVRPRLERIFDYRMQVLNAFFGEGS